MSQPRRTLTCLLIFALCATTFTFQSPIPVAALAAGEASQTHPEVSLAASTPDPLPHGCGGVTPPGEEEPPCCISGFVYIDGQITGGAEVQIQGPRGDQVTMFTQVYSGTETRPYYRLSLSAAPLRIAVGETITVTARYSSHEKSVRYVVQPGSQQVDVVLGRNQADDYVYERQIWGQAEAGKFNGLSGVAVDSAGNVYVLDFSNARVQVFSSDGHFLRQWGTSGALPGQFNRPSGIATDMNNNVYIADAGNYRIQKFSSNGVWLNSWRINGVNSSVFLDLQDISIGSDGNIYVVQSESSTVQVFRSDGVFITSWGSLGTGNGQLNHPGGIAVDSNNNVYITDNHNHRIQKFRNDGTWITSWGEYGNANGQFMAPGSVAADRFGNVYVTEYGNDQHRVQKFSTDGRWLGTWGGRGSSNGKFNTPNGIIVDGMGFVYVADSGNDRIQKFNSNGGWIDSWGSEGKSNGQISLVSGIVVNGSGYVYITDFYNNRVQKFDNNGKWISSWNIIGNGMESFNVPYGIALGNNGNLYVLDSGNSRIYQFDSDGNWISSWGNFGTGNGQLYQPNGISIDQNHNIYIVELVHDRVQKFRNDGTWITTWGEYGSNQGQFSQPHDVVIGNDGNVYVADRDNDRIQKFNQDGIWQASWGRRGIANGEFIAPQSISVDKAGNIFVADTGNNRIQKFRQNGTWLSSWGKEGGPAELVNPFKIYVDNNDHVYVGGSGYIQIFRPMTYTRPIATITYASAASLGQNDTLTLHGLGQDSDETSPIAAYRWTSDRDGVLGTSATLTRSATSLSPGTHRITLQAQDGEGEWSDPVSTTIYVATPPQAQWTMLLYLSGDYHDRSKQLDEFTQAIEELRQRFRNPYVRIAIQLDGPADGDTRRLLITPGSATVAPKVDEQAYAEQAMDEPQVLADFVRWGQASFPAAHYYLAIADHGQAIQGIGWDTTSDMRDGSQDDGAYLTVKELGLALGAAGVAPVDILHLDACSMNLLEVAYEVRQQVKVLIASQYLGWNYFAYDEYPSTIGQSTDRYAVARGITGMYAARARADRVPFTISALDLQRADPAVTAVDQLAAELAALINNDQSNREALDTIWLDSRKFESNGDYVNNDLDMYVDLLDWATKVQVGISSPAVKARAAALIGELTGPQPFIIAGSNHAQSGNLPLQYTGEHIDLTHSNGLSIFYPQDPKTIAFDSYINNRLFSFTSASRWPDFLIAGLGPQPPGELKPLPGPLAPLSNNWQVFLPLVLR